MAQKNGKQNTAAKNINRAPDHAPKQPAPKYAAPIQEKNTFLNKYAEPLIVASIALITYLFLRAGLDNQFTNWDDNGYLTNDPLIKDVSAAGIRHIFSTDNPVMGNYHPLTILSYAIEYSYKGLEPWIYHFDSLILHILCTVAVYIFAKLLTRQTVAAALTALLFGIHPMHVESVAWAAGRKDVLYGLFYMLSCISYIYYLRVAGSKKIAWYLSMLVLFVAALLAKPVAVTLPIALCAIDYFEKRKFDIWLLADKLPGFALSVIFGLLSIQAQRKIGAYNNLDITFTPIERIVLGGYALCTYLWKAVVPAGLCCFYPYPPKPTGSLPQLYYIYPAVIAGIIAVIAAFGRKNRVVLFGLAFFIINIVLLLQFVPVGAAIMADRYSYIPYIGLFFIGGWYVSVLYNKTKDNKSYRYVLMGIVAGYCLVLGFVSSDRCKDWYNSITLWRDEVEKHPESPNAYNNLGAIYSEMVPASQNPQERKKNYDSSLYYLSKAIEIKPDFINSIICLGILQRTNGEIDNAKRTLDQARSISQKNAEVFLELGVVYSIKHIYDSAAYCFRNAITLKPFFPEAHSNFANFYDITGNLDSSLSEYAIAIQQNPDAYIPYLNRGRIYTRIGKYPEAMKNFVTAIEKSPEMGEIYFSRSRCYEKMGNKALAIQDADKAIALGYVRSPADINYYQELKSKA